MKALKICSLLILLAFSQAFGQSGDHAQASKTQPAARPVKPSEIKQKALDAIDREISRAANYENLRDSISIWTTAADMTWEDDPARARKLLKDSYALTKKATAEKAQGDQKYMVAMKNDNLQRKLKTEILLVAQKWDYKLVRELLDTAEPEDEKEMEELHSSPLTFGTASFSKRQMAAFAALLARTEPKKAVDYAMASLGYGVPQEFGDIFRSLLKSDPGSAKKLFSQAADYYVQENSRNLYDAIILAGYLDLAPASSQTDGAAKRLLESALAREQLVWQMYNQKTLSDQMLPGVVISTSQVLYRHFRNHHSDRAGEVESFIRIVSPSLSDRQEFPDETVADSMAATDPEALVAKAEKETDEDNKNALYLEAALVYTRKRSYEKALRTAGHAVNETKRTPVEDYIRGQQIEFLINNSEFYDAAPVISRIADPELRAEATIEFAKKAQKANQKPLALQVLSDTQKVFEKSFSSVPNARAYIWLGSAYASIDSLTSFDLLYSAIKRVNQTNDYNQLNPTPKLVHLGGRSNVALTVCDSKGDFRGGFKALARKNFDQTLLLAENFENKFFRGTAVLAGASAILEDDRNKVAARQRTVKP